MIMTLRQKLRASHVKRWQIVEVSRPQTVAEHSFNVCIIAEEIGRLIKCSNDEMHWIRTHAIHHDMTEVIIGDIATPTKEILNIDTSVLDYMNPDSKPETQLIEDVVKIADTIDAIMFVTMYGVGKHADLVRTKLINYGIDLLTHFSYRYSYGHIVRNLFDKMTNWETLHDDGEGIIWHPKKV